MKEIKISVIIPTWNSAKTLGLVVRSCLNQTLPPIEVLVCDDGSSDNSKEIIENMGNNMVIWVPSKHSGSPAGPRNRGLSMSKGDWVAFCDSDDEWLPTKLEKQINMAQKLKCGTVCTNALIKIDGVITPKKVSNYKKEILSFKNLLKTNNVVCSSAIIHSSIYKEIGGFPEEIKYAGFEDYIYWLRVATKTNFAYVAEPLVIYDDHPETSLRSLFKDGKLLKEKAIADFINWVKKQNKIGLYFFTFQIKKHLAIEWIKNILRNIIK